MFIDNINHQNFNTKINLLDINTKTKKQEKDNFLEYVKIALEEINRIQNQTKNNSKNFTSNKSDISLNDTMIDLEKSSISMQLAVQVRNKIMSAYQEIMNQQI